MNDQLLPISIGRKREIMFFHWVKTQWN